MSRWVDFRELRQGLSIEQVLTGYRVPLKRVGLHQLRGPCPLPTHRSERSRESFSVDITKNVWACHSASCCEARHGRVGGNVLDLVAWLEGCSIRQAALRLQEEWYGAGMHVSEPQRASKGSSGSRSPERPPRLWFSLRLRWHPYLEERAVDPSTAALVGSRLLCRLRIPAESDRVSDPDQEGQLVAYAGRSLDGGEPRVPVPARLPQVAGGV